jgi:hypothetical protein
LLVAEELQIEVEVQEQAVRESQLVILSLLQEFQYQLDQEEQETVHFLGAMPQVILLLLELHHQFHVQVEEEVVTDLTHQLKVVVQEALDHLEDQVAEEEDNLQVLQLQVVDQEFQEKEIQVAVELMTGVDMLEVAADMEKPVVLALVVKGETV